ncbi:MAG: hypothetical protein AB1796_01380 [Bacillota bacterium]
MAGAFSNAGLNLVDSLYKNIESKVQNGIWEKAISLNEIETLPRLIFLKGYWIFIVNKGEYAFKALCPHDNSFLQYRLPDNNLFCLRCSRYYCPATGRCLNTENPEQGNFNLKPLPLKKTEGGIFIYLEK